MPSVVMVRCEQCGSENNPQYHFCGMCGAPLPRPATPPASPVARPPAPVSGPSFLGLNDSPRRDANYLLEDDDEDGSSRSPLIIIGILVVLAAAGCATWYIHTGKWPWQSLIPAQRATTHSEAPPSQPSPTNSSAPASPPQNAASTPAPMPAPTDDKRETAPAPALTPAPAQTPAPVAQTPTPSPPGENAETNVSVAPPASSPASNDGTTETTPPPPESVPAKKASALKPSATKPAQTQPAANASAEDKLALEGERYLYGNGVPQDCDRAQKDILSAAKKASAKSYTLLGAMYATGHCVTRDLPTAYRWFARALHQDPTNTRLEQNLEVLWRQMTPPERQLATQAQ